MKDHITKEKLDKYFNLTKEALAEAKKAPVKDASGFDEIISMVENYISDAEHFVSKEDVVNAFAALSYAHGWLDCGARLEVFEVKNNRLFVVDDE